MIFLIETWYFTELLENEGKYIKARRSGPLEFIFLKEKRFSWVFHVPFIAVVNDGDAMLGEQRHLPLNMKLWISESHLAYKRYYNLFITNGKILLNIILTLTFYVNSIVPSGSVPLSWKRCTAYFKFTNSTLEEFA